MRSPGSFQHPIPLPVFILVALFLLLGLASFTAWTFTHFTGLSAAVAQGTTLGLVLFFVVVIFASFRRQDMILRIAGKITAVAVGFMNFGLLAAIASWVTLGITRALGQAWNPAWIAETFYASAGLITIYGLLNAANLRLTKYTVRLPNLPVAWQGRSVALVTDLHVGNIRGRGFIRRIVARLEALQPAAVFISGDMFDGAKVDIARSVAPWSNLNTSGGIYFVTGNHDEFSDPESYFSELARVGVRVLHNEKVEVEGLQIVGVHDGPTHQPAIYRKLLAHAEIDRHRPSILLAHQPTHLEIPEEAGISLQLSGHTHHGQSWPWSLLVRRIFGRFAYGLNRLGSLQVVTSSGAGSWGPPIRVGTISEIVLLRLETES